MSELLPPVLDDRDAERIAADAIGRVSGWLTLERIDQGIEIWRRLRDDVLSGNLPVPACPDLTNPNPSSPHTMLLEAIAYLTSLQYHKLNFVPERDLIEFAALFGADRRDSTAATTTLLFTVNAPAGVEVTIPEGTAVSADNGIIFETVDDLIILSGQLTGQVAARCTAPGATLLAPHTLTNLQDALAWFQSVTNPDPVDSGSDLETVASALGRARKFQRRGRRLVTAQDFEEAILEEAMNGSGVVRAFPFVRASDWETRQPGYTTIIAMTRNGYPVSAEIKARIDSLTQQAIGNQFIEVKDPVFRQFNVTATLRVKSLPNQNATKQAVERALENFYAVDPAKFGKRIVRSEIIAVIEGVDGVEHIEPQPGGEILAEPATEVEVAPYELPQLGDVTLTVAQ